MLYVTFQQLGVAEPTQVITVILCQLVKSTQLCNHLKHLGETHSLFNIHQFEKYLNFKNFQPGSLLYMHRKQTKITPTSLEVKHCI